jgi:hypothetical protein
MPTYEYRCPANGQTVEVSHAMSDSVRTWGDLCARASVEPGTTPAKSPVEKAVTLSFARTGGRSGGEPNGGRACGPSCGCHPG